MKFDAAVIKEQNITFAVVAVKPHVFNTTTSKEEGLEWGSLQFPGMPIVIARERNGTFEYWGREDIVNFLSDLHPSQLPWKSYSSSR